MKRYVSRLRLAVGAPCLRSRLPLRYYPLLWEMRALL